MKERRIARIFADGSMQVYPKELLRNEKLEDIFEECQADNERQTDPAKFVRVFWVNVEVGEEIAGEVKENNVLPLG